jgi:Homeodomain-like domain
MSKARLVITAVVTEGRTPAEVAATYRVSRSWVYELVARYRAEGATAFEPQSRRPRASPRAIPQATVSLITELRKDLAGQGLDAGPATIAWHLEHHHQTRVSPATISRYLARAAAEDLISAVTAPSQRRAAVNRTTLRTLNGLNHDQHPARLAAQGSPPTTASSHPLPRLVPINHQIRHRTAARHRQTPSPARSCRK